MDYDSDYFEIDIFRLLKALWRRAGAILLAGLLVAGMAYSCAVFLIQPHYESSVLLYVDNSTATEDGSFRFNQAELTAAQTLVNSYLVILESCSTLNAVIEKAELTYNDQELLSMMEATAVDSTEFFEVTITATDPLEAQKIANTIAEVLPEQVAEVVNGSSIRVVHTATVSEEPVSPNVLLWTFGGLVCGLALSAAVVLFEESQSDRIGDPSYLTDRYGIPILGRIRNIKSGKHKQAEFDADAYRILRTQLLFVLSSGEKGNIVGITSAADGEGKTTTAVNLARSLAESGKKVLLLEADLHQPQIANILHLKRTPGLSELLSGQRGEIVQQNEKQSNLYLIPAGKTAENPSELLDSSQMKQLLQTLSKDFDLILLDLPSSDCVSDALSLAKVVDGFLFVVKQESSARGSVEEVLRNFGIAEAKILGFVITNSEKHHGK